MQEKANMFGNIISFESYFSCKNGWHTGTKITYSHYRNHKEVTAKIKPEIINNSTLLNAVLKKMLWQQLMVTAVIEYYF